MNVNEPGNKTGEGAMAVQTDMEDCIVLSDEDSQDTDRQMTAVIKQQPGSAEEAQSSTTPAITSVSSISPSQVDSTASLTEAAESKKATALLENLLEQMMAEIPSSQHAEVAKHAMIDVVRQFPPLWKSSDEHYYNSNYCGLLWSNIAGVFNVDVKTVKMRWRNLRDFWKREYWKSKRTGVEIQNPIAQRLHFLEEEVLTKQRVANARVADGNRGCLAKPSAATASQGVNLRADDDDDDDCMIVNMDLSNEHPHQDDQRGNESEAKKAAGKSTGSPETVLPAIKLRKLTELQENSAVAPEEIPPSVYYTRDTVDKSAKRKSRSRSPEERGKSQKVSTSKTGSPPVLAPQSENTVEPKSRSSNIFVTHAFPDRTWKKPSLAESSVTSNTQQSQPEAPAQPAVPTANSAPKAKSTARKSTGSQYLTRPLSDAISSLFAHIEDRPSPQAEASSTKSARKPSGNKASSKNKKSKGGKPAKKTTPADRRTNPRRGVAAPAKPPEASRDPAKPAEEPAAPVVSSEPAATSAETATKPAPSVPATEPGKRDPGEQDNSARNEWGKENENFLLSLLPEVNGMTEKQFRKLRKYSTALISLILDGE